MRLSCHPATSPSRRSDPSSYGRSHACACKSPRLPMRHFPKPPRRGRTSLLHSRHGGTSLLLLRRRWTSLLHQRRGGTSMLLWRPLCCYFRAAGHVGCSRSEAGHLSCFRFHARLSLVAFSRPRTHAGHGRRKGTMMNALFVFVDEELRRNVQSSWSSSIYNRVLICS